MALQRITDRGRSPYSSARACAAPEAPRHGAGTCACAVASACAAAGPPVDTAFEHASCSPANPLAAASRGYAGSQSDDASGRYPGSASSAPTGPWQRCACTKRLGTVLLADTTGRSRSGSARVSSAPAPGVGSASELFSRHLRQDMLVECEIGDQAFQPRVLVAQLSQLLEFGEPQVAVALLPEVEARFAAPELPAHVRRRCARFHLPQRVQDLFLGESLTSSSSSSPHVEDFRSGA